VKKLLFSVTKKDCRWDYFKGSGKGGQKRNKTENCCRCTHIASGAVGKSEEGKSKEQNKKKAFRRMAESEKFRQWHTLRVAALMGELRDIEIRIEQELDDPNKTRIEVRDDGKWVKPKRKEIKHGPVKKDPHKVSRQAAKKMIQGHDD